MFVIVSFFVIDNLVIFMVFFGYDDDVVFMCMFKVMMNSLFVIGNRYC